MAYSYVQYAGDGSTTDFSVPFSYIATSHIGVKVDGVVTAFTWQSASVVRVTPAPADGTIVEVRRTTPRDAKLVDFTDASVLTEADLDTSTDQVMYLSQEMLDTADSSMTINALNRWDAEDHRIINVADPVDDQDAVTKAWSLSEGGSFVGACAASAASASSSATDAAAAKLAAEAAQGLAEAAQADAETAQTAAELAETHAETAETNAEAAQAAAEAARDLALGYRNDAQTAKTGAETAETNAETAETNAEAAQAAAEAAQTAAEAALDSFDDRYLGAKASDPALDNDGNALLTGALYFNTATSRMRVYSGSTWGDVGSSTADTFEYTATSGQTTFSGTDINSKSMTYQAGFIEVFLDGVRLDKSDYTATNGTSVVLDIGATAGATLSVLSFGTFNIADAYTKAQTDANFSPLGGYRFKGITTYTSGSGTYTVPTGVKALFVELVAGGGGGGGVNGIASTCAYASGGGGGSYSAKLITGTLESSYSYAVGAGGAGGAAGDNNGSAGDATTFAGGSVSMSAGGGGAGIGSTGSTGSTTVAPAAGGTSSGGDLNIAGGPSGFVKTEGTVAYTVSASGAAGGPIGGPSRQHAGNSDGNAGRAPGGGGGAAGSTDATNYAGGDGGDGIIRIWEYY